MWLTGLLAAAALVLTAPRWLPARVVALRAKVFAKVNGDNAITFPNAQVGPERFQEVYGHPAANGRSRGAALSDLFWYWLSPGAEVHQEHLEAGPRYDDVARTTRALLSGPADELADAAARCAGRVLDELVTGRVTPVRLRDLMVPVWAEYCYELVFGEPCPRAARDLIAGHADDVVTALKCTGLRHPARRERLTRYLARRVAAGDVRRPLPASLSPAERVHYLQGTFFNTAVVQLSEAMAHLLLALAQHPEVADRLRRDPADDRYFAHVLDETLRLYPLFGIAHRITTGEIDLGGGTTFPEGTVLCFSYPDYHAAGHRDPGVFDPDRWARVPARAAHHIPFGVAANRPCPAWRLSPLALRAATAEVLRRFTLHSTVTHTRSLPNRGPCLLVRADGPPPRHLAALGAFLRVRDRWEDVWRSVVQLVLGTVMVLHARRLRLAGRYFETHDTAGCPPGHRPPDHRERAE
ncbi:cytochrome P450 [Saccharothrix australiensis]|uniref:Cytochrome P450 n=1 Tax=Saccharothrix australiensis TaxID=2072 RepID=A0A495W3Z2_9PSEU|nr:cytochrome P450 [Saccharothrix australiensis]RKT55383.1 cytochrome P450 [Saccharothrix australiensis]